MKSALLTGPKTIELRDVPDPKAPADGLVVRVSACGICGSDLRRWEAGPPPGVEHIVQGHELAGTVIEAGRGAGPFKTGDRVAVAPDIHCGICYYCRRGLFNLCTDIRLLGITPGLPGGFAGKVLLTGDILRNGIVHSMPPGLGWIEGALAETLSSVLAAHHKGGTALGETVVVMGAGPVGCLHAVVAKARGARVLVAEPNPTRREQAAKFEPEAILDPSTQDIVAEVLGLTGGLGADAVICANPVAATQALGVRMSRRGGRVVLFGGLPKADPMTHLDGNLIHYGEITVVGAFSYHPWFHEEALRMLARKAVRAELFVTHTYPLSRMAEAFDVAKAGKALKVMVLPEEECL